MCPIVSDRFEAVHDEITKWQKKDPHLSDKEGFLEYISTRDIGQFNVGDMRRWMEHYRKAKKRGITVTELLFETRKSMLDMNLSYERGSPGDNEQRVFVVDEEHLRELEERARKSSALPASFVTDNPYENTPELLTEQFERDLRISQPGLTDEQIAAELEGFGELPLDAMGSVLGLDPIAPDADLALPV